MTEWNSVEDGFPEFGVLVLAADQYANFVSIARLQVNEDDDIEFWLANLDQIEIDVVVTHWMPLPSPPLEKNS